MKISVIIPTLNAEKFLTQLVSLLKNQQFTPNEIFIIDSSSSDNTVDMARTLGCNIVCIEKKEFDHGGTRNLGAELASGEVLVFMTQDAIPVNNQCFEELIKPLKDIKIAASFARQIAKPDAIPVERHARLFNYPDTAIIKGKEDISRLGIKTFFFSNVCSAVKKSEFLKVGGFPNRVIMNEDMFLAAKLILNGYKIAYTPDAAVWHSHNYKVYQQFQRYFDIGASLSMNNWILKYAQAEGEGLRFVKEQLFYLIKNGFYYWIPYTIGLSAAKYAGYKLGLKEKKLPVKLKKIFSLHNDFW